MPASTTAAMLPLRFRWPWGVEVEGAQEGAQVGVGGMGFGMADGPLTGEIGVPEPRLLYAGGGCTCAQ